MIKDPSFGDPRGLLTCLLLKVNLFSQMLLLSIFLHEKMKKNQNMIKESSFGTPHGLLTCLLTLSLRTMPVGVVSGLLKFQPFFGHFLLSLQEKTKFIKIYTNFCVEKAVNFSLRSKPVQRNCLHFFKIFKSSARSKG